jgi:hypothetical protein
MNIYLAKSLLILATLLLLSACTVAKLEARLEANPQCKDVVNPKTGALMPCPGSDKAFYRELGLAPAKPTTTTNSPSSTTPGVVGTSSPTQGPTSAATPAAVSSAKAVPVQTDCKPQIHKKTGGTLPCPAPD